MLELVLVTAISGYLIVTFYRLSRIQRSKAHHLEAFARSRDLQPEELEHLKMRWRFARVQVRIVLGLIVTYVIYLLIRLYQAGFIG